MDRRRVAITVRKSKMVKAGHAGRLSTVKFVFRGVKLSTLFHELLPRMYAITMMAESRFVWDADPRMHLMCNTNG
jgi:hypothetical protein